MSKQKKIMDDLRFVYALISILLVQNLQAHFHGPTIKVQLGDQLKDIFISGMDLERVIIPKADKKTLDGRQTVHFRCNNLLNQNKKKNKKNEIGDFAKVSSPTSVVIWNKNSYRGDLFIRESSKKNHCSLINQVDLEGYISGLLSREMNKTWPKEALKAQAVAARTYALYKKEKSEETYDMVNSEFDQVGGTLFDENSNTALATKETQGEVLVLSDGKIGPIFYSAKCGGKTILPQDVWGKKVPGMASVNCPYCKGHGSRPWNLSLDIKELKNIIARALKLQFGKKFVSNKIQFAPDEIMQTNISFYSENNFESFPKAFLRKFLGREKLPSNRFTFEVENNRVKLRGEGLGHGVGMCQLGALDMALKGLSYKKILQHYFPNHFLKKMY